MAGLTRRPFWPREKASYLILRRLGYSIAVMSQAFGRSTSVIHRILKRAAALTGDLRKFPPRTRRLYRARQCRTMVLLVRAWERFMLGEGEKPP